MSHQSEERLPNSAPANSTQQSARILPFERPQSDLQRAIQQRAQEALDVDRDRDREVRRPRPLKWIVGMLVALIPVILILGAVDSFLRVLQKVGQSYTLMPADTPQQQAAPAPVQSQPGVVMLQSYESPPAEQPDAKKSQSASGSGPAAPAPTPPPQ